MIYKMLRKKDVKVNGVRVKENYIVTGMLQQGEKAAVRLLAEQAPDLPGVAGQTPNCEDAYMYCLYQNGCDVSGGEESCCF